MPQYINKPTTQINPGYLQILEQQTARKKAQDEILRQERARNLATAIDNYGGIEAAAAINPNLTSEYLLSTGSTPDQIRDFVGRVQAGNMAANQDLAAAEQEAWRQQARLQGVAQPVTPNEEILQQETVTTVPEATNQKTVEFRADPTIVSTPTAQTGAPLPGTGLSEFSGGDPRAVMQMGDNAALATERKLQNDFAVANYAGAAQAQAETQQKELADAEATAGAASTFMQNYSPSNADQLMKDWGRGDEYRSDTYKGDFAAEVLFQSMTPKERDEAIVGVGEGWEGTAGGLGKLIAQGKLPAKYQNLYNQMTSYVSAVNENTERAVAQVSTGVAEITGATEGATDAGKNFASKQTGTALGKALGSPTLVAQGAQYASENPGDFASKLNHAAYMRENTPDLYYSLFPSKLGQAVAQAELSGKELSNQAVRNELREYDAIFGDEDFYKQYTNMEKAKFIMDYNMAELQYLNALASTQGQGGPTTAEYVKVLEALGGLSNDDLDRSTLKSLQTLIGSTLEGLSKTGATGSLAIEMGPNFWGNYKPGIMLRNTGTSAADTMGAGASAYLEGR